MKKYFTIYLLIFSLQLCFAQSWLQNDLIFNPSGIPSLPFSQPRFADLDNDNDYDMILGSLDDAPMYFENTGSATNPVFKENPDILATVTSISAEVVALVDLDNDGDLDLISGGYAGLYYYENLGDAWNPFYEDYTSPFAHLILGENPVPTFADIDADGDFDMLIGLSESGEIKLYTNTGNISSAVFSDSNMTILDDVGLYAYPYFYDLDADDDFDILCGRDGHGFYYYKNFGDSANPNWQQDASPFSGLASDTYWNSPCLIDITGDSKADLIYGTSAGPLVYYQNLGTVQAPKWSLNTSLFGGVIDVGGASSPFLTDFDGDGDLDLVSGSNLGAIKYYQNKGTPSGPAWKEASSYFSSIKHSIYSAITMADVDGDFLPDAVAGDLNGGLYFHKNTGSGFSYQSTVFSGIDVGDWSAPKLIDFDRDSDFDIVVGNDAGKLFYFENTGTADSASWVEIDSFFLNIDVGSNCVPAVTDLDGDGDYDLLTGDSWGEVQYFRNDNNSWTEVPEVVAGVGGGQNTAPAFADLNGDGLDDLVLGNYDGTFNYFENQGGTFIRSNDNFQIIEDFELQSVYPNPFNSTVTFKGKISVQGELKLEIFNVLGQKQISQNKIQSSQGDFELHLEFPQSLSSGIYFYRLSLGNKNSNPTVANGKLMYIK